MDSPSNFTRGTPSGYVYQKCIPIVFGYKKVWWFPYNYRSFNRSRRALPGTTEKPLDSCKDTSVRAVEKFFYLRNIFMVAMDSVSNFTRGTPWDGGRGRVPPPTLSGYVHQKCVPVVFGYKEVWWPPYNYRSFGRSRQALPGTTEKQLDSCKNTSVRAVGKFLLLKKNFLWLQWILHQILRGVPPAAMSIKSVYQ